MIDAKPLRVVAFMHLLRACQVDTSIARFMLGTARIQRNGCGSRRKQNSLSRCWPAARLGQK